MSVPSQATPPSDLILYQTEDGKTRIQCRFEDESLWLTQAQMADLYQKEVMTINEHLLNIYEEKELAESSTIRKFRIVRIEGKREVTREISHYSLQAILAVGFRVRSQRGTQFRQWANERLSEYLVKGFAMDDERLRQPVTSGLPDYFDELLERIRDIRASEQRLYLRVKDILALGQGEPGSWVRSALRWPGLLPLRHHGSAPALGVLLRCRHHLSPQPPALALSVESADVNAGLLRNPGHALPCRRTNPLPDVSFDSLAVTTHCSSPEAPGWSEAKATTFLTAGGGNLQ